MEVQEVLVVILFLVALVYMGRSIYRNAKPEKGCGGSCKCGIDFSNQKPQDQK